MKAQNLKIMMIQQSIGRSLIGACLVVMFIYAALLASTMFYATETMSYNRQVAEANGSLSNFEFEYISLKQSVTMAKAEELGFTEVKNPTFVRADNTVAVTMNDKPLR
jgi:predicted ATPase